MWVGGTEKNIANAFKEAKEKDALLVFDEVDSFLQDRSTANKNWEITQVNEMLVQMEEFDGIFIATTNLLDNLDKASLRRFDLKMNFDFMKSEMAFRLFQNHCRKLELSIDNISEKEFKNISKLTPGDFAAVIRQNRFRKIRDSKDFFERLVDEIEVKNLNEKYGNVMGFNIM